MSNLITFPDRSIEHTLNVPAQTSDDRPYSIEDLKTFVQEAQEIHSIWRPQAWYSEECVDGVQWTDEDYQKAKNEGIDPLTINKQFGTIQVLIGLQINNKYDTIIKGRTQMDVDMGSTMTECVRYVYDQMENGTDFIVSKAWKDQCVPGIGWIMVHHNDDPREEIVRTSYRDWKEMWWDPFADPWLDTRKCRYAFHMPYVDLENLIGQWPEHEQELREYASQQQRSTTSNTMSMWDEAQEVEDLKTLWGRTNNLRTRVRPVEMYFPYRQKGWWAIFANGDARPVPDITNPKTPPELIQEAMQMIRASERVGFYNVRRMWQTTFLDDIVLSDGPTEMNHDQYPYIPFVGYLDRYGFPYGAPHQTKGQMIEINKRRSMLLALLQKRRVIADKKVVGPQGGIKELQALHDEANKLDGMMVLADGTAKFDIIEAMDKGQLQAQAQVLQLSENEFREVSGVNAEQEGLRSQALSGVAQEKRKEASSIRLSSLFENLRRSRWIMAAQVVKEIQGKWKGQKVLRVTDKQTSAERFVKLNERVYNPTRGIYEIKNNVTQGKYDQVISEAPATDTVREMNGMLIMEAVKKSTPDVIPELLTMYMEMSNVPNKDMLVNKLRRIYNLDPGEADLDPEEAKVRTIKTLEEHRNQAKAEADYQNKMKGITLQNLQLENMLLMAKIEEIMGGGKIDREKLALMRKELELKGFKMGYDVGADIDRRGMEKYQASLNRADEREQKGAEG